MTGLRSAGFPKRNIERKKKNEKVQSFTSLVNSQYPCASQQVLCVHGESLVFYMSLILFSGHTGGLVFAFADITYSDL